MLDDALTHFARTFSQGGFTMVPLVLFAMGLWYGLGYRALTLRRGSRLSLRALVALHRREPRTCAKGLVDAAARLGAQLARQSPQDLTRRLDVAFDEIEQEAGRCRVLVRSLVVVAPLTGLLGTVSGMIETFDALAEMALFTQSGGIAGGISEALFSTQMGLVVAIPGLLLGRLLERREQRLGQEIEELKAMLVEQPAQEVTP